jgi:hypothetical protein
MIAPLTLPEMILIQGALEEKLDWLEGKKFADPSSNEWYWSERVEVALAALKKVNELIKAA